MKNIIQIIKNVENMRFIKPATMEQIKEAEDLLGVIFSDDYVEYVKNFGVVSGRGIELTGITEHERLSVVSVTRKERILNPNIPKKMYVIENLAIDGILALQDDTGKIYTIAPNENPKLLYDSLAEYIENANF